jgi:GAF domain-containing protein
MWFQEIAEELLLATKAARVTIRVEQDDGDFPVIAEAAIAGVRRIKGQDTHIREAVTFHELQRTLRLLVQDDVLTSPPVIPDIVTKYGVRAQMLAPIVLGGRLRAIISVHETRGPRKWMNEDIDLLTDATRRVEAKLRGETTWL